MSSRAVVVLLAIATGACTTASAAPPSEVSGGPSAPKRTLERSGPLPKLARALLHDRMMVHGDDMEGLLWASILLEYDTVQTLAARLGTEPKIMRPDKTPLDSMNAGLPPLFFDLQDQFYAAAERLEQAAKQRKDLAIADAYSQLAQTCVRCHSVYLTIEPIPEAEAP